jgi:HEAT repeat protein
MLGSYGDVSAIPLLIEALDDPELTGPAIGAFFYLSIHMHDSRIGDAIVRLMETPRDYYVIDHAIYILEELKDPRVASIGLWLLDHAQDVPLNIPPTAEIALAIAHQRSFLRMKGAFAFARFADSATGALVARLTHENAEIRAAAAAALRQDPQRGPHLEKHLTPLLRDGDPAVRQQAEMAIQFLKPPPPVEISPERMADALTQAEAFMKRAASRKKDRF